MKGCGHDGTLLEDECDCIIAHTNNADAGLPHTSLTDHIADLEGRLSQIERISGELVTGLAQRTLTNSAALAKATLVRALAT